MRCSARKAEMLQRTTSGTCRQLQRLRRRGYRRSQGECAGTERSSCGLRECGRGLCDDQRYISVLVVCPRAGVRGLEAEPQPMLKVDTSVPSPRQAYDKRARCGSEV